MKHGKRPTVKQKKYLKSRKLNPDNWLVSQDSKNLMIIIHRETGRVKYISK